MSAGKTEENMDGGNTQDIEAKGLSEDILLDRNEWRKVIRVPDPA